MPPDDLETMRKNIDVYYTYEEANECEIKLCLDIVLYYPKTGIKANAKGIVHFYQKSMELIAQKVQYYYVDGRRGRIKKLKKEVLDMLPFWASEEAGDRGIYGLVLESGHSPEDMSDSAFHFYDDQWHPGWVRLMLPLEYLNQGVSVFIELAKFLAGKIRFLSGSAGFAVNIREDYNAQFEFNAVYSLSRRYRGIDFGKPSMFCSFMEEGIKCVNWLTFVGETFLDKLGGLEKLEQQLGEGIIVHPLPHGVMIQAGPQPEFGDVNRKETLPYYHQVGKALKPIRSLAHTIRGYNGIGGEDNTREWLARFDE